MSAFGRLFRALDYLKIRHPAKTKYDLIIPLAISALVFCFLFFLPIEPNIFAPRGLVEGVSNLLGILTGFFIASLAAVSTFNKQGMDYIMPGDPMILNIFEFGETVSKKLTRRRFLCLLFGYLAFLSIFLYLFGIFANLSSDSFKLLIPTSYHMLAKWLFVYGYLLILSNLIVTTLLGLFYMVDRIHRHDPILEGGISKEENDG